MLFLYITVHTRTHTKYKNHENKKVVAIFTLMQETCQALKE